MRSNGIQVQACEDDVLERRDSLTEWLEKEAYLVSVHSRSMYLAWFAQVLSWITLEPPFVSWGDLFALATQRSRILQL